jgi:F-type H+-transporting ATPase subunit gamma
MAKGLRDIKRQIKSIQSTKQITKAMEMVAAANLRKAQQRAEMSRPYAEQIQDVIASIAQSSGGVKHPMLQARPVKKTGYIIITSDRGLAGGFNANVLKKLTTTLSENHASKDEYSLFVVGRKGRDFLKRRGYPIGGEVTGLSDSPRYSDVKDVASEAVSLFESGAVDELYLVYNKFVNAITQIPVANRLLPLAEVAKAAADTPAYEYEPSAEEVLAVLLPKYAETLVYSAVLESKASEFGARMTAMGNATKNATKIINDLTLQFNRARQAAITQEISEIVAGANAQA